MPIAQCRGATPIVNMSKPSEEEQERTAALWAEYKSVPTSRLRNILVEKYTPLVHKIAGTFAHKKPSVLDYDDLVQAGRMGLLDAIEKFDPQNERKAQFQTYATFRVRGAILDEINSMDWTPRSVRQDIKEVLRSIEKHYSKTSLEPTVQDIAKSANLDRERTRIILSQMDKTYVVHVDNDIIDIVGPTTDHAKSELESIISIAMDKVLTPLEKSFIQMKYFMGYNNKEIQEALELKVSELKHVRDSAIVKLSAELENPIN
jgi:RNA polymerase sigma factor for flagellar operon FliA